MSVAASEERSDGRDERLREEHVTDVDPAALRQRALDEKLSLGERVLACVELIPPGRVMSYKDVAEFVGLAGARHVGRVLAYDGGTVAWHRVLRSNGTCAEHLRATQLRLLAAEGVPIRGERVDMAAARWDGRSGSVGPM